MRQDHHTKLYVTYISQDHHTKQYVTYTLTSTHVTHTLTSMPHTRMSHGHHTHELWHAYVFVIAAGLLNVPMLRERDACVIYTYTHVYVYMYIYIYSQSTSQRDSARVREIPSKREHGSERATEKTRGRAKEYEHLCIRTLSDGFVTRITK